MAYLNKNYTSSQTLVEHWDGTRWAVVSSPNPSATMNILNAVAAVSPNDVWAVGFASNGTANNTLIEHWNSTVWSVVPGPNTSMTISNLAALAVVSANDVWAVGSGRLGDEDATITIHWDGAAWSLISSPNVVPEVDNTPRRDRGGVERRLGGGYPAADFIDRSAHPHFALERPRLSIVPSPNDGGNNVGNHLLAATQIASNNVWAVGYSEFGTLSEHWDGFVWSVIPTPFVPDGNSATFSGAVPSSNGGPWAIGDFFQNQQSRSRTLTEFWNGAD